MVEGHLASSCGSLAGLLSPRPLGSVLVGASAGPLLGVAPGPARGGSDRGGPPCGSRAFGSSGASRAGAGGGEQ